MTADCYILYCENPVEPGTIDPEYTDELDHAKNNGFKTVLFNFDEFTTGNAEKAIRKIKLADILTPVIYRGWMLTPAQYMQLYEMLLAKNFRLINTPGEYRNCHYLPDSLAFIEEHTPKTIFKKLEDENSIPSLVNTASAFGSEPVIVKDFVKSEKHDWDTACFVNNASDAEKLTATINKLIELRGKHLNEGIVIREFVELKALTTHSKSGMPLMEEYRLFFCNKALIGIYDYWEEGEYAVSKPDTSFFENIAKTVQSNFFSMDLARKQNGELIIIELGDGQVAGLPDQLDKAEFYARLKSAV